MDTAVKRLSKRNALKLGRQNMYFPLVWSWYSSLAGKVFRVLLEHAARNYSYDYSYDLQRHSPVEPV